ncbi:MAG: nucleoside monophosphate kinase [Nanoarchaeota archaeon]|nr:nucleoside monophosphate kinase [Nanoarchaeota archaeon]
MIITISGKPGCGKSTVAKIIAKEIGYKHISGGDMRGEIAKKHNMTIDELNKLAETEDWTDREVDDYLKKLGETEDNFCIDSRTAFHFIPHATKIFIDCDLYVAAERIFKDQRLDEKHQDTAQGVREMIKTRWELCRQRWIRYYGFDIANLDNYNLIIDSSHKTIQEVVREILEFVKYKEK